MWDSNHPKWGVSHRTHARHYEGLRPGGMWSFHNEKGSLQAQGQKGASGISQGELGSEQVCPSSVTRGERAEPGAGSPVL